jgi:hypothetical protein
MSKPTQNGTSNGTASGTNPSNGTSPELSSLTVAKSETGTAEVKDSKDLVKPPVLPKPLSIAERLKKLDKLNKLTERRTELVDALDDVNGFILSPASPAKLSFLDAKNHSFSISHQGVIAEIIELIKKKFELEIEKVDAQITFE